MKKVVLFLTAAFFVFALTSCDDQKGSCSNAKRGHRRCEDTQRSHRRCEDTQRRW